MMVREAFDWLKPAPLWDDGLQGARRPDFFQPQLVQLTDDNFMATVRAAALSNDTSQLKALVVSPPTSTPLKLFQAAHGCHYLVCAELSCRMQGFPDRVVQRSDGESVFVVMRRFVDSVEYGWVVNGTTKIWQSLNGQPRSLLANEERLPLFPIACSGQRTLFVGYVPVATGDVYALKVQDLNAGASSPAEQARFPIDIRIELLQAEFTTPLENRVSATSLDNVIEVAYAADQASTASGQPSDQALTLSVYLLLNLWEFFENNLPDVAAALRDNPQATFSDSQAAAKTQLMAFLANQPLGGQASAGGLTLGTALGNVARQRDALNAVGGVDPQQLGFANDHYTLARSDPITTQTPCVIDTAGLESAVQNALPADNSMLYLPRQNAVGETYALRCVYERPQCSPPLQMVSQPSLSFQLASFFDNDAPARPIRIIMPTDVSIGGMRKFQKGVTFVISNSLQQKINMVTGFEKGILKDPPSVGAAANGLSWMCSFSIQIVFIVAFFLLLMFVIILNICFWWIAFFRICIPIPKKFLSG
jgi:hypothetical protein